MNGEIKKTNSWPEVCRSDYGPKFGTGRQRKTAPCHLSSNSNMLKTAPAQLCRALEIIASALHTAHDSNLGWREGQGGVLDSGKLLPPIHLWALINAMHIYIYIYISIHAGQQFKPRITN